MELEEGTFARILVAASWHSALVAHDWLKPTQDSGDCVELNVEILEVTDAGIWSIDHDQTGTFMEDAHFWIPWAIVVSVESHPDGRVPRKNVGFSR